MVFGDAESPVSTYGRSPATWARPCCAPSPSRTSCRPTGRRSPSWTRVARRSPTPLYRSIRRRYNPGLRDILTEASLVGRELGWYDARVRTRVGRLERGLEPVAHFTLYDEQGEPLARARHMMLALGRGPLAFPPLLARARQDPALATAIIHAYEEKTYSSDGRCVVLGAGIAAGNECSNALSAGARVIALRRRAPTGVQDLNVPRCMFEARGIDAFQRLPFQERVAFLEGVLLRARRPSADCGWSGSARGSREPLRRADRGDRHGPATPRRPATARVSAGGGRSGLARGRPRDLSDRVHQVGAPYPVIRRMVATTTSRSRAVD